MRPFRLRWQATLGLLRLRRLRLPPFRPLRWHRGAWLRLLRLKSVVSMLRLSRTSALLRRQAFRLVP